MFLFHRPLHRQAVVPPRGTGGSNVAASTARESWLQREQRIDEELAQSFPASDPPSWVQGVSPRPC
jgi:hypothetical protein